MPPARPRTPPTRSGPARGPLRGRFEPPGDKSLSHRALLLAAIAGGPTELRHLNPGADVAATAAALRALGVSVERRGTRWIVDGDGVASFRRPTAAVDCGNSGTTMRLLAGVLAACPFASRLVGDASLSARPMGRIAEPLRAMGASVSGRTLDGRLVPPLRIRGGGLDPLRWTSPVASAQVKSAILLAGLAGGVEVEVTEPHRSRDHTERMLRALGAHVTRRGRTVRLEPGALRRAPSGRVPGDPSAAAFFAAAAAARRGSDLRVEGVGLNAGRLGFFRALARMGATVERDDGPPWCGEPQGGLRVRAAPLGGVRIGEAAVPSLVDELPVLAVLAAGAATGVTVVSGAGELRVKESDRIAAIATGLRALGARIEERPDGWRIEGGRLGGGTVDAGGDHRVAMAFRVAGLLADGRVRVRGADVARVSHPGFDRELRRLLAASPTGKAPAARGSRGKGGAA